jgi:chaperone modulatory protein CbpM
MEREQDLVPAQLFCTQYRIEYTFIQSLQESGLIRVETINDEGFIPAEELRQLERYVRLHHDLDINLEGIEAIAHLLNRVEALQTELSLLSARLRQYEEGEE